MEIELYYPPYRYNSRKINNIKSYFWPIRMKIETKCGKIMKIKEAIVHEFELRKPCNALGGGVFVEIHIRFGKIELSKRRV